MPEHITTASEKFHPNPPIGEVTARQMVEAPLPMVVGHAVSLLTVLGHATVAVLLSATYQAGHGEIPPQIAADVKRSYILIEKMKFIQQSLFRALCAIAVGALLVEYRQEMVQWMVIAIGILFFLSGIVTVTMVYVGKKTAQKMARTEMNVADNETSTADDAGRPKMSKALGCGIFAGTGSMVLGIVLALMPGTFVNFLVYILSAILILGAIQQFFSLALASRIGSVGIMFWVMPSLILIAGVIAVAYPEAIASAPLFFIGWCLIIYGIVECINGIKYYKCNKNTSSAATLSDKPDFSDAETVEYEETGKEQ